MTHVTYKVFFDYEDNTGAYGNDYFLVHTAQPQPVQARNAAADLLTIVHLWQGWRESHIRHVIKTENTAPYSKLQIDFMERLAAEKKARGFLQPPGAKHEIH